MNPVFYELDTPLGKTTACLKSPTTVLVIGGDIHRRRNGLVYRDKHYHATLTFIRRDKIWERPLNSNDMVVDLADEFNQRVRPEISNTIAAYLLDAWREFVTPQMIFDATTMHLQHKLKYAVQSVERLTSAITEVTNDRDKAIRDKEKLEKKLAELSIDQF